MTFALGSITFDEARGVVTPQAVPVVTGVQNPGLTPAVVLAAGADRTDRLTYRGFFATSQVAALWALVGTVITVADETGSTTSVLVRSVDPVERPARCAGTLGKWTEVAVGVTAWA